MADPTKEQKEVKEAIDALREIVESKSADSAHNKERIDKIDTFLDVQESKNQEYITELKSAENKAAEMKERMDALEVDMARRVEQTGVDYKQTPEYKSMVAYSRHGITDMDPELKAILRTDVDAQGGYTVTGELDNIITKQITEISGLRSVSRVRTIAKKTLEMPIRTGILSAFYEGEAEAAQESNSNYGSESLTAFRLTVDVPITHDLLMNSDFNMESEILTDAAESFAQKEGAKFILGTDVKQPEGILVNPTVVANARVGTTSGLINADDMILLTGDLKVGYNPVYVMNRLTLATLRTLKSTDGVFLWQPGMNGPVANTINGAPYVLAQDMPDIAGDALAVAYGDFNRGYTIIDRTGVAIIRDDVTRKGEGIVEFNIKRWNYGKVVLPEAIKLLKILT